MRCLSLFALVVLTACKDGGDDTDPPDTDPATVVDTDPPWGDEDGSLALIRRYAGEDLIEAQLVGFFANSDQGFVNLASCALQDHACLRELPTAAGQFVVYDPEDVFVPANSFYRYVGLTLPFGPYEAFYDVTDEWSFYYADLTELDPFEGAASLELGVEWGPFQTDSAAVVPPGLMATAPASGETSLVFSDEAAYPFQWEPGGGEMYLTVQSVEEGVARVYKLDDTGEFLLDLGSLGLTGDHLLAFQLSRWTFDLLDVNGSDLTVQTTADAVFFAQFIDVFGRDPIGDLVRNSCADGFVGFSGDGQFYGDLSSFTDDSQQAACLPSFDAANGRDGRIDIEIPPRTRLDVSYRQLDANASMYVLESCDEPPVCLLGADSNSALGIETLSLFNPSDTDSLEHVLVLDAADPLTGALFFVDIETLDVPDPGLVDTCVLALASDPIQPGTYYADGTSGLFDNLDPGFTGCTGTSLPGPDGMLPVLILDGQTLEVTISMEDADPALYLLQNCQDATTCLTGSDISGNIDTLIHTNTTGATQQGYLVLDTGGGSGAYTLTVGVF